MTAHDQRPVCEFDHHSPEYAERWVDIYDDLRRRCPVAWSPNYGGCWVVSSYDEVARIARDDATFSSEHDVEGTSHGYGGIVIPSSHTWAMPIELDPPEFLAYRHLLNPPFAPAALERWEPLLQEVTSACIDAVIESGEADLVLDVANPIPAIFTLSFIGLPVEQWREYAEPMHEMVYSPPGSEGQAHAGEAIGRMFVQLYEEVAERRVRPRDDLITYLVEAEIEGEPLADQRIVEILFLVVAGGVDTTTALLSHAFLDLHRVPEQRARLVADPSLLALACEEFLRYYSPTQTNARTVTHDVDIAGQHLAAGDRVLLSWAAANRDGAVFDDPHEFVINRSPNRHTAFGLGIHRCLGSNFARAEFRIILGEVLRRMPDYRIDVDRSERYESIGNVYGYVRMPATFTPGPRVGTNFVL